MYCVYTYTKGVGASDIALLMRVWLHHAAKLASSRWEMLKFRKAQAGWIICGPQGLKSLKEGHHQLRAGGDDHILLVSEDALSRPVERAAEQTAAVDEGELVVHEVGRVVRAHLYADSAQSFHAGPAGADLLVVGDDANDHTPPVGADQYPRNLLCRESVHAHVERSRRRAQYFQEGGVVSAVWFPAVV